jgi:hypothetical protein
MRSSTILGQSRFTRSWWRDAGATEMTLYRDDLALLIVDVADSKKNRNWMKAFKVRWKEKLEQLELWMVSYSIDIE